MSFGIMNILGGHLVKCVANYETRIEAEADVAKFPYPFGTAVYEAIDGVTFQVGREYKRNAEFETNIKYSQHPATTYR